ncbi:phage tail sheath subtilisin-like domain-containing protein [Chengkuizengella marina]|uniref:Phage tail sheath protein n=1 Tax=Chengkuizengella marina TaxID=2507566 RepID=A0A6N9Q7W5_9BACL|nr:phage tail sheath subtilisin-like domain-containing protein [Chengkuizengella marina]NBI30714.1 phage tail sheath protein [Chengkuizengella marina]
MGLPEININFSSLSVSAIQRSQRGIVALILKDDTGDFETREYRTVTDINDGDWTAGNMDYIEKAFLGVPSKVIIERLDVSAANYNDALTRLASKRWNYLAIPGISNAEVSHVSTWLKSQRDNNKKTFKAVLPNSESDHAGIINFTTEGIEVGDTTYSTSEYTARIAGVLAGLPLTRSSTYFELNEVDSITESETPDADIDAGQLILMSDGEKVKIGRGVNSLTTTTVEKGEDFKKIKIIEGHDLIREDITRTFNDNYVGKVNNSYDNQVLFITAVNAYLNGLLGEVLDGASDNKIDVDVEAQRKAWESQGTDMSEFNEQQVKQKSYGSKVFIAGKLKFLDAVEDLNFNISV